VGITAGNLAMAYWLDSNVFLIVVSNDTGHFWLL